MKVVVVGGHSRNIGKTSVMAGLIRSLHSLGWTAAKITQYGHGICSLNGKRCECAPTEHPFELTEETNARGRADTCRFLAAGASRPLWLRVRECQLAQAFPLLMRAVDQDDFVMMESNSIVGLLEPDLYLMVLDSTRRDFKDSARAFLDRADALVPIDARLDFQRWSGLDPGILGEKPVFPVAAGQYITPELCDFVRFRLLPPKPGPLSLSGN